MLVIIVVVAIFLVYKALGGETPYPDVNSDKYLGFLVLIHLPYYPLMLNRFHDIGQKWGWFWALLPLFPIIDGSEHATQLFAVQVIIHLYLLLLPGDKGDNEYGEKQHVKFVKALINCYKPD